MSSPNILLSPLGKEFSALKQKQSAVKSCRKREKGKVDTKQAKIFIMSQYFEKENEDPNVRDEHLAEIEWDDSNSLSQTWKQKVPGLNNYFQEVDNYEFEVETLPYTPSTKTPVTYKLPTYATPSIQCTPMNAQQNRSRAPWLTPMSPTPQFKTPVSINLKKNSVQKHR